MARVIELTKGSRLFAVESSSRAGSYWTVDLAQATCTCPQFEYRCNSSADSLCKHQLAACDYEAERERLQALMPLVTAKAVERVTGEKPLPRVSGLTDAETRRIFA